MVPRLPSSLMRAKNYRFYSSKTPYTRRAFKAFPEVLVLDATYRTNKVKMPLFVFVVQNGLGISHIVAYAFVSFEQQHVVTRLRRL